MKNNLCLFFTSQSRNPASSDLPCSNILLANSICIYIQIIFKLANVFISKLRLHLQQTEIEYFTYAPNQPWPGFPASHDQDNQAWKNIPTRNFLGAWNKTWLGSPIHLLPFQ